MTYKIDEAIKEITETLRSLEADAMDHAKDDLADDPATLAQIAFGNTDSLAIAVNGVGCKLFPEHPPLAVMVMDLMEWKPIMVFDEIDAVFSAHSLGDGTFIAPYEDEEKADVDRAIAALQSGIDRLRAHEAERLKAQS